MIRVAIHGAAGRMGHALINACINAEHLQLAAAVERPGSPAIGTDAGTLAGLFPARKAARIRPIEALRAD